jgi:hypothetical protein
MIALPSCPRQVRVLYDLLHRACLFLVGCCVEFIVWQLPKATIIFILLIFCCIICRPKRREIVPPIHSAAVPICHNTSPHHQHCLLVGCCVSLHHLVAVYGQGMYFFNIFRRSNCHRKRQVIVLPLKAEAPSPAEAHLRLIFPGATFSFPPPMSIVRTIPRSIVALVIARSFSPSA